jgi:hypothetical protein
MGFRALADMAVRSQGSGGYAEDGVGGVDGSDPTAMEGAVRAATRLAACRQGAQRTGQTELAPRCAVGSGRAGGAAYLPAPP